MNWYFMLFFTLIIIVPTILMGFLGFGQTEDEQMIILIVTLSLIAIHIIPSIMVSIRRLHDIGKSGWWYLISFIPYVGSIIIMILAMIDSKEDNEYGVNPKTNI